jgi:hypothetical protein
MPLDGQVRRTHNLPFRTLGLDVGVPHSWYAAPFHGFDGSRRRDRCHRRRTCSISESFTFDLSVRDRYLLAANRTTKITNAAPDTLSDRLIVYLHGDLC